MKLWGGRFESGPSEVFERFSESLHFDKRLLDVDIRGSLAQARALERVGILTIDERDRMLTALDQIREESRLPQFFGDEVGQDHFLFFNFCGRGEARAAGGEHHPFGSRRDHPRARA